MEERKGKGSPPVPFLVYLWFCDSNILDTHCRRRPRGCIDALICAVPALPRTPRACLSVFVFDWFRSFPAAFFASSTNSSPTLPHFIPLDSFPSKCSLTFVSLRCNSIRSPSIFIELFQCALCPFSPTYYSRSFSLRKIAAPIENKYFKYCCYVCLSLKHW